ncbi:tyr, partial [Symbiodinium necroappetens]
TTHPPDGGENHCRPIDTTGRPTGLQKRLRKDIKQMTDEEFQKFAEALNLLKNNWSLCDDPSDCLADFPYTYDSLLAFHPYCHRDPQEFLVMHRRLLFEVETRLQVLSGDCSVTFPYWNSNRDAGDLWGVSEVWSDTRYGRPEGGHGPGDDDSWCSTRGERHNCVRTGVARDWTERPFAHRRSCSYCVNRAPREDFHLTAFPVLMAGLYRRTRFEHFQSWIEAVHAQLHIAIGGDMAILPFATADPVFLLHHAFVDYLFLIWQVHQHDSGNEEWNCQSCSTRMTHWRSRRTEWMGRYNPEHRCYEVPLSSPTACVGYSGPVHRDRVSQMIGSGMPTLESSAAAEAEIEDCVEDLLDDIELGKMSASQIEEEVVLTSKFRVGGVKRNCREWFGSMRSMEHMHSEHMDDVLDNRIKSCQMMEVENFHEQEKFLFEPTATKSEKRTEVKCRRAHVGT